MPDRERSIVYESCETFLAQTVDFALFAQSKLLFWSLPIGRVPWNAQIFLTFILYEASVTFTLLVISCIVEDSPISNVTHACETAIRRNNGYIRGYYLL